MADGVSVSLVSINVWKLAGDTLNITCNFLYCNHQVDRYFLIALYYLVLNLYGRKAKVLFKLLALRQVEIARMLVMRKELAD
jgi:hypothetical protein